MGPRSRDRGNASARHERRLPGSLQWGRDRAIAEFAIRRQRTCRPSACFNGAAIARSRNCETQRSLRTRRYWLQWGRDRAIAELWASSTDQSSLLVLQWGRDRAIAELRGVPNRCPMLRASMGPRSRDRGIAPRRSLQMQSSPASMGPRSRDRGIRVAQLEPVLPRQASMGPRSRDRGIAHGPPHLASFEPLQWGRDRAIAELRPTRT